MVSARLLVGIVAALMAHLGTAQNSDTAASGDTDTLSPSETEPEPQPPHNREHRRDPQNTTAPPAQPTPDPTDIKPSELDPVSPTIINAESPHESKAASTHTTAPAAGNGSPSVVPLVSPGVSLLSVPAPASASPSAAAPVNLTTWTYNYTVDRNSPMFPLAWIRLPPENSSQSSETTSRPQLGATGLGGVGFSEAFSPTSSAVPQPPTSLAPQENQIVNRHARRQVSQSEAVSNSTFSFTGTGVTVKGEGSFILKTGDGTEKRFDAAETNVTLGQRVEDYTLSLDSPNSTVTQLIVHSMSEIDQDAGSPFCENITLAEGSNLKSAAWLILTGSVRVQDGAAMLESASSMTIKLPDSASRVALYGITDPSFGTYVASSSAVVDGGKSTGSAQRERADDVLYSDISFTPRAKLSNSLILRSTGGRVGVNKFQICYAS
ncbi:hypothetical protein CC85DRAFT_282084 [Cutaneotrichosporon oleaginosum]|uniref:Uncharacterized protein n=1 Tax=Cutaneotrichosporon oleaginosum TaxID=879819 RepID=A0A0J0XY20_9TREE|nr:uncharacterized protein CC85DRAFT_282084 [Cutaneotrichosporon oleaginosum]KLT45947.1 hypothetical protein CC85DRAFT_282084 [Cutaneotrichosporon oleaginosum]TXT06643.1 hypothetical protein COLE_05974 [Cutaneotrichosporon oleaginosum]